MMHGHEKSDSAIVAVKPMNKAERFAAESVERRGGTKGNVDQQRTRRTQRRISVSKMLARIRQHIVAVDTRGGNRMRESCTYGSVLTITNWTILDSIYARARVNGNLELSRRCDNSRAAGVRFDRSFQANPLLVAHF